MYTPPRSFHRIVKTPCLDCPDRRLGCHGVCEKYAAYRAQLDEEKNTARRANADQQRVTQYEIAATKRYKK